ncbi:MAG TPA: flagellar protein [Firmicutes bacterium]|nr:flagellar protein [Bacillota bacterium]
MSEQFKIPRGLPIRPVEPRRTPTPQRTKRAQFAEVLDAKLQESSLKFSAHATRRLQARKINLSKEQLNVLEEAVEKVRAKGGRESLILLDDIALVVSVANRTVITAINGEMLKDNVFTQIDSAVIT